jgi:hypothetical protein
MNVAVFAVGFAIVVGTWVSVLRTLVIPRGLSSRLNACVTTVVRGAYDFLASRFDAYETKDSILVGQGPTILLALLVVWVGLFLLGFGLMFAGANEAGFYAALRESGSWVFTLGSAATNRPLATAVGFFAAATGLVVVALQVGYLPTLYGAFNRREMLVTMLQSRAGEPAWGPEILARHHIVATLDKLPSFYAAWEEWAADVSESHSNYPVLITFRSPHPARSWVVGLLAVLDSAAMHLALNPSARSSEARLCLRMGFTCMRDICRALDIPYDPDPRPDASLRLTYDDFLNGVARLEAVGYPIERSPEEAWPHFQGWRVNYEQQCYAVARTVEAVPAVWSGPRKHSEDVMLPVRPPNRTPESPDRG